MMRYQRAGLLNRIVLILLFVTVLGVAACDSLSAPAHQQTPSGIGNDTPSPTPANGLQLLTPSSGWHVVLDLSNPTGQPEIKSGAFTVTKPYTIMVACKGNGNLIVDFTPQGNLHVICTTTPQITSSQVGTDQNPPQQGQVHFTVTDQNGQGSIVWHILVTEEN